ncbi:MAG: hypothetical protein GX593_09975, partial [Actinomycetales bacterium]|nr:hypothetical protein [Actinomycetales bacterium]
DAGDLLDYDVVTAGQTYRYNPAAPLFGLGHGLGYSTVEHESVTLSTSRVEAPPVTLEHAPARWVEHGADGGSLAGLSAPTASAFGADGESPAGREVIATVTLRNTGDRPAEELVAVWAQPPADLPVPAPRTRLLAWTRVRIERGARVEVRLPVEVGSLAVWDVAAEASGSRGAVVTPGAFRVQAGTYRLASGPSAADLPVSAELTVVGPDRPVRSAIGRALPAAAFDAYAGIVTADLDRFAGDCVEVALGAESGWARYGLLDLAGARRVRLRLARRRIAATRPSELHVEVRAAESWQRVITPVTVPNVPPGESRTEAQYQWVDVVVPLDADALPADPADVRVTLTGAARLAALTFEGDARD